MRVFALVPMLVLASCVQAQTTPDAPYFWKLVSIDGVPFTASATLAIDGAANRAFGQAPCNQWSGEVITTPFPEWNIRNVTATRMACPELAAESDFLNAMQAMTHSAVGIRHLELVDQQGREMKFVPVAP